METRLQKFELCVRARKALQLNLGLSLINLIYRSFVRETILVTHRQNGVRIDKRVTKEDNIYTIFDRAKSTKNHRCNHGNCSVEQWEGVVQDRTLASLSAIPGPTWKLANV